MLFYCLFNIYLYICVMETKLSTFDLTLEMRKEMLRIKSEYGLSMLFQIESAWKEWSKKYPKK